MKTYIYFKILFQTYFYKLKFENKCTYISELNYFESFNQKYLMFHNFMMYFIVI